MADSDTPEPERSDLDFDLDFDLGSIDFEDAPQATDAETPPDDGGDVLSRDIESLLGGGGGKSNRQRAGLPEAADDELEDEPDEVPDPEPPESPDTELDDDVEEDSPSVEIDDDDLVEAEEEELEIEEEEAIDIEVPDGDEIDVPDDDIGIEEEEPPDPTPGEESLKSEAELAAQRRRERKRPTPAAAPLAEDEFEVVFDDDAPAEVPAEPAPTTEAAPDDPIDELEVEFDELDDDLEVETVASDDALEAELGDLDDEIEAEPVAPDDGLEAELGDLDDEIEAEPVAPDAGLEAELGDLDDEIEAEPVAPDDGLEAELGDLDDLDDELELDPDEPTVDAAALDEAPEAPAAVELEGEVDTITAELDDDIDDLSPEAELLEPEPFEAGSGLDLDEEPPDDDGIDIDEEIEAELDDGIDAEIESEDEFETDAGAAAETVSAEAEIADSEQTDDEFDALEPAGSESEAEVAESDQDEAEDIGGAVAAEEPDADNDAAAKQRPLFAFKPLELAGLAAVLVACFAALFMLGSSVAERISAARENEDIISVKVPSKLKGEIIEIGNIECYWRNRLPADRVDETSQILPLVELSEPSGSGLVQILFRDAEGDIRGDGHIFKIDGDRFTESGDTASALSTEGLIREVDYAYYSSDAKTAEADRWSVQVRESADGKAWADIAVFIVPADRRDEKGG